MLLFSLLEHKPLNSMLLLTKNTFFSLKKCPNATTKPQEFTTGFSSPTLARHVHAAESCTQG